MDAIQIMTAHLHSVARTVELRKEIMNCTCNQWHNSNVSCAEFQAYQEDMEAELGEQS